MDLFLLPEDKPKFDAFIKDVLANCTFGKARYEHNLAFEERIISGYLGEFLIRKYLGLDPIPSVSKDPNRNTSNDSDLPGIMCDIKTGALNTKFKGIPGRYDHFRIPCDKEHFDYFIRCLCKPNVHQWDRVYCCGYVDRTMYDLYPKILDNKNKEHREIPLEHLKPIEDFRVGYVTLLNKKEKL